MATLPAQLPSPLASAPVLPAYPTRGLEVRVPAPIPLPSLRRTRGPLAVLALASLPLVFWATALPLSVQLATPTLALRSLALASALVGTAAFALNLILGARLGSIERFFGGLDKLYRVHRRTGEVAVVLVLAHAALITASYATISPSAAVALYGPAAPSTITAGVVALVGVLLLLGLALGPWPRRHEAFVQVHRGFGVVYLLGSVHAFSQPGTKAASPALSAYLGTLAVLGLLAWVYRSVLGRFLVPRRDYRVAAVHHLDEAVTEIVMRPRGTPLRFEPGQFLFVSFHSRVVREEPHPFSITSAPHQPELTLLVKALGDFTTSLKRLEPGARAKVEGPYGGLSYRRVANPRQVWIAGGIGVTPFLSMLRSLGPDDAHEIDFYYASDHAEGMYFLYELYAIADEHPRVRIIPIRADRLGHLTAADVNGVARGLSGQDILLCGPPTMVRSLHQQLRQRGVADHRIHSEEFSFR